MLWDGANKLVNIRANGNSTFIGGNFGIGSESPSAKLVVREDQVGYSYFDFYNETADGGIAFRQIHRNIADTGSDSVDLLWLRSGGFVINNNDTHPDNFTAFKVGSAERVRITSAGDVGIGTANPESMLTLQKDAAGKVLSLLSEIFS